MTKYSNINAVDSTVSQETASGGIRVESLVEDLNQASQWVLKGRPNDESSVQQVAISTQQFNIGRHLENSFYLPNETVSSHHAELVMIQGDLFIRDLNSTNGTLLNGKRLQELVKLKDGDILHFGNAMFIVSQTSNNLTNTIVGADVAHEALGHLQFEKLLRKPAVTPFFQPVVRLNDLHFIGYEVLARSQLIGLETPDRMFRVASELDSEVELSCLCRSEGLRLGHSLGIETSYFLNTCPIELDDALLESLHQLRESFPEHSIVLEVHESAVTSTEFLLQLRGTLDKLGMRLAYDDFGAGESRLMELTEVPPDVLKFDIRLIQGIFTGSAQRLQTVGSLVKIVRDLDIVVLAEGVETQEEADICRDIGFDLAQGYLFGRPAPAKKWTSDTSS